MAPTPTCYNTATVREPELAAATPNGPVVMDGVTNTVEKVGVDVVEDVVDSDEDETAEKPRTATLQHNMATKPQPT